MQCTLVPSIGRHYNLIVTGFEGFLHENKGVIGSISARFVFHRLSVWLLYFTVTTEDGRGRAVLVSEVTAVRIARQSLAIPALQDGFAMTDLPRMGF